KACDPKSQDTSTVGMNASIARMRACLERELAQEIGRARPAHPKLAAQGPTWQSLTETLCRLHEEFQWVDFSARWRPDGTLPALSYGSCVLGALEEQSYFFRASRGTATEFARYASGVAAGAPHARKVLASIEGATARLLAAKLAPGKLSSNYVG